MKLTRVHFRQSLSGLQGFFVWVLLRANLQKIDNLWVPGPHQLRDDALLLRCDIWLFQVLANQINSFLSYYHLFKDACDYASIYVLGMCVSSIFQNGSELEENTFEAHFLFLRVGSSQKMNINNIIYKEFNLIIDFADSFKLRLTINNSVSNQLTQRENTSRLATGRLRGPLVQIYKSVEHNIKLLWYNLIWHTWFTRVFNQLGNMII